jgi:hypothetical protein
MDRYKYRKWGNQPAFIKLIGEPSDRVGTIVFDSYNTDGSVSRWVFAKKDFNEMMIPCRAESCDGCISKFRCYSV